MIYEIGRVPIRRTTKVKSDANPYDKSFDNYFSKRQKEKSKNASFSHQKCITLQNYEKKNRK